jgi:hypothetical protein
LVRVELKEQHEEQQGVELGGVELPKDGSSVKHVD